MRAARRKHERGEYRSNLSCVLNLLEYHGSLNEVSSQAKAQQASIKAEKEKAEVRKAKARERMAMCVYIYLAIHRIDRLSSVVVPKSRLCPRRSSLNSRTERERLVHGTEKSS
jgi:hypothetical protein